MQQRSPNAAFVGGAWVFPGGKLDSHDQDADWLNHCSLDSANANRVLQLEQNAHAYWIAAIRELVEEAGILLTEHADSGLALRAQRYLQQNPSDFLGFCKNHQLTLRTDQLRYLSRWITPEISPRRYDTRFFLGRWPEGQEPTQDNHEAINTKWVTPDQALAHHNAGEWVLVCPTIATLQQLCGFSDVESIMMELGH